MCKEMVSATGPLGRKGDPWAAARPLSRPSLRMNGGSQGTEGGPSGRLGDGAETGRSWKGDRIRRFDVGFSSSV